VSIALQVTFHANLWRELTGQASSTRSPARKLQNLCFLRNGVGFQTGSPGNTRASVYFPHAWDMLRNVKCSCVYPLTPPVAHLPINVEHQTKTDLPRQGDPRHATSSAHVALWMRRLQKTSIFNECVSIMGAALSVQLNRRRCCRMRNMRPLFGDATDVIVRRIPPLMSPWNFVSFLISYIAYEEYTAIFQMLLCGECYENVYT
jgi:hypothetical protein